VLASRGKVFCAGADLNWMKRMGEMSFEENRKDAMLFGQMLKRLHSMKKPTLARVHGAAFAGAMGLIAACDIAVASADAEFSVSKSASASRPRPSVPTPSSRRWRTRRAPILPDGRALQCGGGAPHQIRS
jgi:hypothetical protein